MSRCSICSYQRDNWYVSNWRLACYIFCGGGRCSLEVAQRPLRVALAWQHARVAHPSGEIEEYSLHDGTEFEHGTKQLCGGKQCA